MTSWRILTGDVREQLSTLPAGSVRTCVTSPPYWGLRDYGTAKWEGGDPACDHKKVSSESVKKALATSTLGPNRDGVSGQATNSHQQEPWRGACGRCGAVRIDNQLGLERTPEAYCAAMVSVFAEVRRVLADDGTVWLNLGDSYAGGASGSNPSASSCLGSGPGGASKHRDSVTFAARPRVDGLKPKDLVGIPWMVAKALRDPYYHGSIKDERDRIWLAAMLDAEGCMFIQKRKAGQNNGQGYQRQNDNYGPGVEIANTSRAVVDRIMELVGKGSICSQGPDETGGRRKQTIYRWNLRTTECRDFVRELYPYLVAKQQQARILIGCPSSGERAEAAHEALKSLHRTGVA